MLTPKTLVFSCKKLQHICTQNFERKRTNPKLNNIKVRSRLSYPKTISFLSVSDLLKLDEVQSKEHTQKKKTLHALFLVFQDRTWHTTKSICKLERVANQEYKQKNQNINIVYIKYI
jgi:hypothetical protein